MHPYGYLFALIGLNCVNAYYPEYLMSAISVLILSAVLAERSKRIRIAEALAKDAED